MEVRFPERMEIRLSTEEKKQAKKHAKKNNWSLGQVFRNGLAALLRKDK